MGACHSQTKKTANAKMKKYKNNDNQTPGQYYTPTDNKKSSIESIEEKPKPLVEEERKFLEQLDGNSKREKVIIQDDGYNMNTQVSEHLQLKNIANSEPKQEEEKYFNIHGHRFKPTEFSEKIEDLPQKNKEEGSMYPDVEDLKFLKKFCSTSYLIEARFDDELDDCFNYVIDGEIEENWFRYEFKRFQAQPFICKIKKYLIDLLKRCQNFACVKRLFDSLASTEDSFEILERVSERNLITCLMTTLSARSRATLGKMLNKTGYSIPFAFFRIDQQNELIYTVDFPVLYGEGICNYADYPLVVNIGTKSAAKKGKTAFLTHLFGIKREILNFNQGFYLHSLGADMICPTDEAPFYLADVHGYSNIPAFKALIFSLIKYSCFAVVSITKEDFSTDFEPKEELKEILKNAPTSYECGMLIILRDYNKDQDQIFLENINQKIKDHGALIKILALANFKEVHGTERNRLLIRSKKQADEIIAGSPLKAMHNKKRTFRSVLEIFEEYRSILYQRVEKFPELELFKSFKDQFDKIDHVTIDEYLFPITTIRNKIERKREEQETIRLEEEISLQMKNQMKMNDDEINKLKIKKNAINKIEHSNAFNMVLLLYFRNNWVELILFEKFIEEWKKKFIEPLIAEREAVKLAIDEKQKFGLNTDELFRESSMLTNKIDKININPDHFWVEIMNLYEENVGLPVTESKNKIFEKLKQVYTRKLIEGYPVYLLRGDPLEMESTFLKEIFDNLSHIQNLFILSVLGVQSSAKSTLLNMLFGTSFWTSAGRCTKGMFLSLIKIEPNVNLLILDTEGLMSVEGLEKNAKDIKFDNQMAVMSFGMSNEVILNHKGDISRELQNLIEISLFAMKHVSGIDVKPTVYFVLRDQADRKEKKQKEALEALKSKLKDSAKAAKLNNINEYINLEFDELTMLPSAIIEDKSANGVKFKKISDVFCDECKLLKSKLIKYVDFSLRNKSNALRCRYFDSLASFYTYANTLWMTLKTSRDNLLNFKTIEEIVRREKVERQTQIISKKYSSQFNDEISKLISDKVEETEKNPDKPLNDDISAQIQDMFLKYKDFAFKEFDESLKNEDNLKIKTDFRDNLESILRIKRVSLQNEWNRAMMYLQDKKKQSQIHSKINDAIGKLLKLKIIELNDEKNLEKEIEEKLSALHKEQIHEIEKKYYTRKEVVTDVVKIYNTICNQNRLTGDYFILLKRLDTQTILDLLNNANLQNSMNVANWFTESNFSKKILEALRVTNIKEAQARLVNIFHKVTLTQMINLALLEIKQALIIESNVIERALLAAFHYLDSSEYSHTKAKSISINFNIFFPDVTRLILVKLCEKYVTNQESHKKKELEDFESKISKTKENFVKIFQSRKDSKKLGEAISKTYFDSILKNYTDSLIQSNKSALNRNIRNKLSSQKELYNLCYKSSFEARKWKNVFKFVTNINRYLEEIFKREAEEYLNECQKEFEGEFRKKVKSLYSQLTESVNNVEPNIPKLEDFNSILRNSTELERYLIFQTGQYEISSWKEFSDQFLETLGNEYSKVDYQGLQQTFQSQLDNEINLIFRELTGCPKRCPNCGGKCINEGVHKDHSCNHLIPAFYGWKEKYTRNPLTHYCLSKASYESGVQKEDKNEVPDDHPSHDKSKVVWYKNLMEWISDRYPEWNNEFCKYELCGKEWAEDLEKTLQRAWVNTRKPIIKKYKLVDPGQSWYQALEEKDALDEDFSVEGY